MTKSNSITSEFNPFTCLQGNLPRSTPQNIIMLLVSFESLINKGHILFPFIFIKLHTRNLKLQRLKQFARFFSDFLDNFTININGKVEFSKFCIDDIYFFEVHTKYISSSAVKKSVFADIFTARVKYIWYLSKKVNFLFILYSTGIQKAQLFPWSFFVRFDIFSVFIGYNIGCKHGLHLENALKSYFNEWNIRN